MDIDNNNINIVKFQEPASGNGTELHTLGLKYEVATPEMRAEQERTTINKKLFLEHFIKYRGIVLVVCDKIGVSRRTFYYWYNNDPSFSLALKEMVDTVNEEVEDVLMYKIFFERDGACVRYWLDRRHPDFKPKSAVEHTDPGGPPAGPIEVRIVTNENQNKDCVLRETGV